MVCTYNEPMETVRSCVQHLLDAEAPVYADKVIYIGDDGAKKKFACSEEKRLMVEHFNASAPPPRQRLSHAALLRAALWHSAVRPTQRSTARADAPVSTRRGLPERNLGRRPEGAAAPAQRQEQQHQPHGARPAPVTPPILPFLRLDRKFSSITLPIRRSPKLRCWAYSSRRARLWSWGPWNGLARCRASVRVIAPRCICAGGRQCAGATPQLVHTARASALDLSAAFASLNAAGSGCRC